MKDPRVQKLARLLTEYSLNLKPGKIVLIRGNAIGAPLIRECYRAALRCGAYPFVEVSIDGIEEIFYREASKKQLKWVSPIAKFRMQKIDAYLGVWADTNTKSLTSTDPKRVAIARAAHEPIMNIFMKRAAAGEVKWVGTQWPCNASAQDAEMSLEEYEEFVFGAGHLNDRDPVATWKRISKAQQALTDFLNKARAIRVVAEDTDLRFSCRGRRWINCDGHENFPDGEVFTGPVEDSVTGHIKFSFPAVHSGREVDGVRLTFERGKVAKAEAGKGQDFLRAMIAMDKGASYLGECAIGTNYNVKRYTKNTLFDEKIGGTVHFALGAGYPETGNKNRSGLHWDMVCDLRNGGEIWADGELIQKNGRFLNTRFPQP
jgi:aminopeptidase